MAQRRTKPAPSRVRKLAGYLAKAGWTDAARGVVSFVEVYGVPISIYDNTVEISETPAGDLIALHNGEVICSEHGLSSPTNQSTSEAAMPLRQFRCNEDLFDQFAIVANKMHRGNRSDAIRTALRLYVGVFTRFGGNHAALEAALQTLLTEED